MGISGSTFRTWHRDASTWRAGRRFGRIPRDGGSSPFVASATTDPGGIWATTSDGTRYALWHSADGDRWTRVDTPASTPSTAGDHTLAVAAADVGMVLLSDDGRRARVWTAR